MFISTGSNEKGDSLDNKSGRENNDNDSKKSEKKQPLEVNLVKITDGIIKGDPNAKEELKHHIKMLKTA